MNAKYYATRLQSIRMKELGYNQETENIWIRNMSNEWVIMPRNSLEVGKLLLKNKKNGFVEYYNAPTTQEIELRSNKCYAGFPNKNNSKLEYYLGNDKRKYFGKIYHAQARAAAWIWEAQNENKI
jgi:hypothetical protein